jgi:hypothetical protein
MTNTTAEKITNNGLTKHVYHFELCGTDLYYNGYSQYNRNDKSEPWPDKWPDPLPYQKWLKENNLSELAEYDEDGWDYETEQYDYRYEKYRNTFNPCMVHTTDGRTCGYSEYSRDLPKRKPIDDKIKQRALKNFTKVLRVK